MTNQQQQHSGQKTGHRILLLIFIFANSLRLVGLFPYRYDRSDQIPQLSLRWRIYSGFCLATYILVFTAYCSYVTIPTDVDHLMDFVRISEMVMIGVMLLAIIITEQCFYGPCSRVLIQAHRNLRDIFEDFLKGNNSSAATHPGPLPTTTNTTGIAAEAIGRSRQVVATAWKFLLRSLILMIICASIAYSKFILVLKLLPIGWNYFGMLMLVIPFVALSLASSKVCFYIHVFDHAFQMLNRQIQLMVRQLNAIEMISVKRLPWQQSDPKSEQQQQQHEPRLIDSSSSELKNNEDNGTPSNPIASGNHQRHQLGDISDGQEGRRNSIRRNSGRNSHSSTSHGRNGRFYHKQKLMFEFQQLIYHTRQRHDSLMLLVEEFFQRWALYMLLFLAMQFSLLVIEAFFLFTNVYGSIRTGQPIDQSYALLNLRSCLMVVIELTWTIGACSNLMDSIQRIGVTLNGLVTLDVDAGLVQTIETWTIKLLCQPNAVQVFQLFDINNGLLYSIIGAVCGYLVILIQFKLSDNNLFV